MSKISNAWIKNKQINKPFVFSEYQLVEQGICVGQVPSINPLQGAL